ncbi:hypothetical protein SAMN06297129_0702 [Pseudooceanicola antarcticus]|uniref:Immunity protein 35 n=1 Tax=Pseudooceanicola antarcticus TaxID=1247613 RepID=A0A285HX01_9RHOB|nr:hypothetical protein [Pseudooceanicola antarcticus]SNY40219.1 hypothetical protein SAMN06297129_0702 [Pseudooceanicola antarcticus]
MDIREAELLAQEKLAEIQKIIGEDLEFSPGGPRFESGEWCFYYNTKEAIETGNPLAGLAGNGPICIDAEGTVRLGASA